MKRLVQFIEPNRNYHHLKAQIQVHQKQVWKWSLSQLKSGYEYTQTSFSDISSALKSTIFHIESQNLGTFATPNNVILNKKTGRTTGLCPPL